MILDKPYLYWIYVIPNKRSSRNSPFTYKGKPLSKQEYLDYWGKWVIMDEKEKLNQLARQLEPHVESRAIYTIKYTRVPERIFDIDSCVMCVFCDAREREEVWQILSGVGVNIKAWIYDREVIEMWRSGGVMLEQWLSHFGVKGKEAEEIRISTQEKLEKWLANIEDEAATGPWSFELIS